MHIKGGQIRISVADCAFLLNLRFMQFVRHCGEENLLPLKKMYKKSWCGET